MADILIRGVAVPERCDYRCPFYVSKGFQDCGLTGKSYNWGLDRRPPDCPIIELPEHGDLIDREWLKGMAYSKVEDFGGAFLDTIDIAIAPVIVPASKEETE